MMTEDITKWQKTDVVFNVTNMPIITLTESKHPNVWYHDKTDNAFYLTAKGFKMSAHKLDKNRMRELGLLR